MVLSENLRLAGWDVVTRHKCLGAFSRWVPDHKIETYPEEVDFEAFDRFFIFYTHDNPFSVSAMQSDKARVLYPYKRRSEKGDLPLQWGRPFVRSLAQACAEMGLPGVSDNGFRIPEGIKKKEQKVLIHAVSSTERKDWPIERFLEVARGLRERGFDPVFVVGDESVRQRYESIAEEFSLPGFTTLDEIAEAVAERIFHRRRFGFWAPGVVLGRADGDSSETKKPNYILAAGLGARRCCYPWELGSEPTGSSST